MKPVIIIVGALIIAGGVVGAAKTGMINIPGLSPKPKPTSSKGHKPPDQAVSAGDPKPEFEVDSDKGAAAVAEVWNGVETSRLVQIVEGWNDTDLARVVSNMDGSKASELLAALPADRASRVSQQIQDMASRVPVAP